MEVALVFLQVPHGLALDPGSDGQDRFLFLEPYSLDCLRVDVQHPLELVGLIGKEN